MSTTTQLLKASYRVLREDKRLIALPAAAFAGETVALAAFALACHSSGRGFGVFTSSGSTVFYLLLAAWYLVSTAISTYFNTALFFAVARALRGEEPDVRGALAEARRRIPMIIAWSTVSSTVALVLNVLDRRIPIVSAIMGYSWSCLSFLALPVMVFEGVGVRDATRRTKHLFRTAWAEEITGTLRIGGIGLLLAIPAVLLLFLGLGVGSTPTAFVAMLLLAALWICLCMFVLSCLSSVFRVAVYIWAATGATPPQFSGVDLGKSFRTRPKGLSEGLSEGLSDGWSEGWSET